MTELSRVPPSFRHTISGRGVWRLCTLERSCIGPMHGPTPSAPFHHFAVRIDHAPLRMGWRLDGKRTDTNMPEDHISIIPAGVSFTGWSNGPGDFLCVYVTPSALTSAVGEEAMVAAKSKIRPVLGMQSPTLFRLIRTLHSDTVQGHPYGKVLGESIFVSMAALLVNDGRIVSQKLYRERIGDRRIRRTLEYIHANLDRRLFDRRGSDHQSVPPQPHVPERCRVLYLAICLAQPRQTRHWLDEGFRADSRAGRIHVRLRKLLHICGNIQG